MDIGQYDIKQVLQNQNIDEEKLNKFSEDPQGVLKNVNKQFYVNKVLGFTPAILKKHLATWFNNDALALLKQMNLLYKLRLTHWRDLRVEIKKQMDLDPTVPYRAFYKQFQPYEAALKLRDPEQLFNPSNQIAWFATDLIRKHNPEVETTEAQQRALPLHIGECWSDVVSQQLDEKIWRNMNTLYLLAEFIIKTPDHRYQLFIDSLKEIIEGFIKNPTYDFKLISQQIGAKLKEFMNKFDGQEIELYKAFGFEYLSQNKSIIEKTIPKVAELLPDKVVKTVQDASTPNRPTMNKDTVLAGINKLMSKWEVDQKGRYDHKYFGKPLPVTQPDSSVLVPNELQVQPSSSSSSSATVTHAIPPEYLQNYPGVFASMDDATRQKYVQINGMNPLAAQKWLQELDLHYQKVHIHNLLRQQQMAARVA